MRQSNPLSQTSRPGRGAGRNIWPAVVLFILAGTILACLAGSPAAGRPVIRNHLPTLTPTALAGLAPAVPAGVISPRGSTQNGGQAASVNPATPAPSPAPGRLPAPAPAQAAPAGPVRPGEPPEAAGPPLQRIGVPMTAAPAAAGWSFSGVQATVDPELGEMLVYGEMSNDTGEPQRVMGVQATFYDGQGQPLVDNRSLDYLPAETVPAGERVPFELTVIGAPAGANLDLSVEARPDSASPRQDFSIAQVAPFDQAGEYCLAGQVQNPGAPLASYLTIVAVLYDAQDGVIGFNSSYEPAGTGFSSGQPLQFTVCINPSGQPVARYEVRAWGL